MAYTVHIKLEIGPIFSWELHSDEALRRFEHDVHSGQLGKLTYRVGDRVGGFTGVSLSHGSSDR